MSTFHVKSWRARMGWDRKQAANKLEISVHTIKSYELLQRSVPAPIEQLMKKIEAEKVVGNGSVHGAPIRIVGGGTVSHIRNHLALCAPAYGSTAKALLAICQAHDQNAEMILTRMADPSSSIETSADLENWVKSTVADHNAKIVFWNPAIVDYNGSVGNIQSGKKADRLKSREGKQNIEITPAEKLVTMFRESRKDLFLVAFKTTTNATTDEQYAAGLSLLKNASANLVLANDTVTGMNMVIVPEEARYHQTIDREVALAGLVEMTILRSKNTFTRSRVMSDIGVSWNDEAIPENLKTVVEYCISKGAYKPFKGKTVGHFAVRGENGAIITSRRKSNFNDLPSVGMVKIKPSGENNVLAYGGKPSVGGMSQKIIFDNHPDAYNIVHFHCPLKKGVSLSTRNQRPFECGSHECGLNTSEGLEIVEDGILAVMLDNHGPNIVYGKDVSAQKVISFIEKNFDLKQKTGGLINSEELFVN